MRIAALVALAMALAMAGTGEAQQFSLVHNYAHLEGSPANSAGQGASPEYSTLLKAHDRRRLAGVANFPLRGDDDPTSIGLYFTQISLGTPPRQYYVQVDTGSDVLWVNCAPCPGCPLQTDIQGITLQYYDPALSSTDTVLNCGDQRCIGASDGQTPSCTSSQACAYSAQYGDGSSTSGYFINDVLTFQQVDNLTITNATANIFFGCGTTQTGNLLTSPRAVDGLMGFGQAAIAVPSQLAALAKVGRVFAHCLQGDNQGGGTFVIGNILEPDISYTPLVPQQVHYNVGMQNIAVNGMNITSPESFAIRSSGGGVIMDSGTTLAYLVQPAYDQFLVAVSSGAPVASQQIYDRSGGSSLCWIYSGDIASSFPSVQLIFAGGAVMNLAAKNYLYSQKLSNGGSAYCMGWLESTSDLTIFGDIVLKDQLVVYDNDNQRVGWKPFDCTQSIRVSAPNSTTPMEVLPGAGSFGAGVTTRSSIIVLSSCLAFALLCPLL